MNAPDDINGQRLADAISRQAAEWFVANQEERTSEAQRSAFVAWLLASPLHMRDYLSIADLGCDLARACADSPTPAQMTIDRANSDVVDIGLVRPQMRRSPPRGLTRVRLAAAILLALIAAGSLSFWILHQRTEPGQIYATGPEEQSMWRLPDGSLMHLAPGSGVKVQISGRGRRLTLQRGRAFFQVAHDSTRPFLVAARDTLVTAVGTQFAVELDDPETLVTVLEGKVAVQPSAAATFPVAAGQQAAIRDGRLVLRTVDSNKSLAWVQRQITFEQQPLAIVVKELNRFSEVPIVIADPALSSLQISGVFKAYDTDALIAFLRRLDGVIVITNTRNIVVTTTAKVRGDNSQ